jgi:hypothetical protein
VKKLREYVILLIVSIVVGGTVTTYLEEYERKLLMPLRNIVVLGSWRSRSEGILPISRYRRGEAINPVHAAQTVRETTLKILDTQLDDYSSNAVAVKSEERHRLLKVADYFVESAEIRHYNGTNFCVWTYSFDYPVQNLEAPWISGLAQGHVVEVLLAANELTRDDEYLELAKKAADAMTVPIQGGGVAVQIKDSLWFEEYAKAGVDPPLVLNGHNTAVEALYYLSFVESDYEFLFEKGVDAVEQLLPRFDRGIWSMYDLAGIPAKPEYQRIHVSQLRWLYEVTNREAFKFYANKFNVQLYLPLGAFFRILVYPNRFLVLIFVGNTTLVMVAIISVRKLKWLYKPSNDEATERKRPNQKDKLIRAKSNESTKWRVD